MTEILNFLSKNEKSLKNCGTIIVLVIFLFFSGKWSEQLLDIQKELYALRLEVSALQSSLINYVSKEECIKLIDERITVFNHEFKK